MNPSKKILMIEDEPGLRRSVCAYLEDSGFVMVQAGNGREGVERFAADQPDLVLTDLRMPEMNGVEVVRHIKAASPRTPIIVLTGTGDPHAQTEALRLGACACVSKPVKDLAELEAIIMNALAEAEKT